MSAALSAGERPPGYEERKKAHSLGCWVPGWPNPKSCQSFTGQKIRPTPAGHYSEAELSPSWRPQRSSYSKVHKERQAWNVKSQRCVLLTGRKGIPVPLNGHGLRHWCDGT